MKAIINIAIPTGAPRRIGVLERPSVADFVGDLGSDGRIIDTGRVNSSVSLYIKNRAPAVPPSEEPVEQVQVDLLDRDDLVVSTQYVYPDTAQIFTVPRSVQSISLINPTLNAIPLSLTAF